MPLRAAALAAFLSLAAFSGLAPSAHAQALSQTAFQNADTASRIRTARGMSANRAFQADQEARQKKLLAEIQAFNSRPPPQFTASGPGGTVAIPLPGNAPAMGPGLVVNHNVYQVNIQSGSGNVAGNANTAVSNSAPAGQN